MRALAAAVCVDSLCEKRAAWARTSQRAPGACASTYEAAAGPSHTRTHTHTHVQAHGFIVVMMVCSACTSTCGRSGAPAMRSAAPSGRRVRCGATWQSARVRESGPVAGKMMRAARRLRATARVARRHVAQRVTREVDGERGVRAVWTRVSLRVFPPRVSSRLAVAHYRPR